MTGLFKRYFLSFSALVTEYFMISFRFVYIIYVTEPKTTLIQSNEDNNNIDIERRKLNSVFKFLLISLAKTYSSNVCHIFELHL